MKRVLSALHSTLAWQTHTRFSLLRGLLDSWLLERTVDGDRNGPPALAAVAATSSPASRDPADAHPSDLDDDAQTAGRRVYTGQVVLTVRPVPLASPAMP